MMAWEDRTPAERAQAEREAVEYAATDNDVVYTITTGNSRYIVNGINSARVVHRTVGGTVDPPFDP